MLDPTEFHGLNWPEPDGITIAELAANVSALADGPWRVIGAGITECVTDDAAELRRLTPLLAAVGAVLT
ncbi:MAG: hypothetical protein J2O49_09965 [Sciscionella sp.]|nr:hypothetical protein [Sciscionella sp.]